MSPRAIVKNDSTGKLQESRRPLRYWIPAFAGMTAKKEGPPFYQPASGSALYAPGFCVERRVLKTTHRAKQAAVMRSRTKNAFL